MTERTALFEIMKLLYAEVPCCQCCQSDIGYMDVREEAAALAAQVGILAVVKTVDCYKKHKVFTEGCEICRRYADYEVTCAS